MKDNLINNFGVTGYRESEVKVEQFGAYSFRTAIIDDGGAMVETKGGMPRVTPLRKKVKLPCADTRSPLSEVDATANRGYWEPVDEEPDERVFSHDGLLSLPKRIVKTIKTTSFNAPPESPTRPVYIRFAHDTSPAVTRPGDLVEEYRSLGTTSIPAWFKGGLAYVSKDCVESIKFKMGNCPVTLNFKTNLMPPFGTHGGLNGVYNVTTTEPIPCGASSLNFVDAAKRLSINMETDQAFLEPYSYKVLGKLRGGELLPKEQEGDTMVGAFFSMDKWGSPFKCFAHSTGLYVDHTRANKITKPDPKTFPCTPNESIPARYFRFSEKDDVWIENTECYLLHDIQFNGGQSYPGSDYADDGVVTLGADEHLYRDETEAIWRIRFSYTAPSDYSISVTARLLGRVDKFLDPDTDVIPRDLLTETFTQQVPGNYSKAKGVGAMYVESLPNGQEAALAFNSPYGDEILDPRPPESVFILKCAFSGVGGKTGAGITATFEQFPTITTYQTTERHYTPVSVSYNTVSASNVAPNIQCVRQGAVLDYYTHEIIEWVDLVSSPNAIHYGSTQLAGWRPSYCSFVELPLNYENSFDRTIHANIQFVARANNTWDMLRVEFVQSAPNNRVEAGANDYVSVTTSYCGEVISPWFDTTYLRGTYPFDKLTVSMDGWHHRESISESRTDVTYSCGEHKVTGYVVNTMEKRLIDATWSNNGHWDPLHETVGTFSGSATKYARVESGVKTDFWQGATVVGEQTITMTGGTDGVPVVNDSGTTYSGDSNLLQIASIPFAHAAGNRHYIQYEFDRFNPPHPTVKELIHGVAIERPATGYTACDDPRNTRVVLLPTDDAGLFF